MGDFETHEAETGEGWRARPFILAGIGIVAAVLVEHLILPRGSYFWSPSTSLPAWRVALAIGIGGGAAAIGFSLERVRIGWAIGFGVAVGVVAASIFYWNGEPGWGYIGDWRCASLILAIGIAVPLFQTARDEGGARFPYVEVHGHAWTNVVLWFACWFFTGIVFALAWLLSSLFDLIGLHFLRQLLGRDWFNAALFGAAFGGALGLFRERDRVVRLLQRVVTAVLGVLAPVLGVGLLVFLVSLPFTGLGTLWEATRSTTPILLTCVIGALILANAVIGNGTDEELHNPVLRWGAMALALAVLPLAVIAAIATGLRIGQYGLTPDRLWALTFVILASAYGLAYFVSLVRGRMQWGDRVRPANLRMAFVVAGVALFLATPLLSFNALSTRDQVARLEGGRITPDKFDWAALAFDFGDSGRVALKRLTASADAAIKARALTASAKTNRYDLVDVGRQIKTADQLTKRLRILPRAVPVPEDLRKLLTDWNACTVNEKDQCTLLYVPGGIEAITLRDTCIDELKPQEGNATSPVVWIDRCGPARFILRDGKWRKLRDNEMPPIDEARMKVIKAALAAGQVEVRPVTVRQVFVGGVPVGEPFE
ncbi:DUF4153 domain-containing protein [Sphingomonas sp. GB1N7]|uniref:DUF4153 domain-containing protein n=1 Tax=Parasphingomonas caseinilytica TaxID=3096158 RepID=UPI002FC8A561